MHLLAGDCQKNSMLKWPCMSACHLDGFIPTTTVYSCFVVARERGTYNILKWREEQGIRRLVLAIDDSDNPVGDNSRIVTTTNKESTATTTGDGSSLSSSKKSKNRVFRNSPRQASTARLEAKIAKTEHDMLYKAGCFHGGSQPCCCRCGRNNSFLACQRYLQ